MQIGLRGLEECYENIFPWHDDNLSERTLEYFVLTAYDAEIFK